MKTLLFIMLAGCAVRCEDKNYYVIEVPEQPLRSPKTFKVYWNVPTMQCASKKIPFRNLYEKFGIIQNDNDRFKGEKVTILYDPGLFPALFKNESSGKFRFRNGGVPQEGNLDRHLLKFKDDLDESIPDENFSGVGIIDFESWRPVFRQNFGTLQPYKDVSIEIERKLHPWWKKASIEAEARSRFTKAGRSFMEATLVTARTLRPRAVWGFYGFPYCFNMAANNMYEACARKVPEENDEIPWLWSKSTALFPSLYSYSTLTTTQLVSLIRGRVREASRHRQTNILPYMWFRYRDGGFFNQKDLNAALSTIFNSAASGIIIWGSSNDVDTVPKCNKLYDYVENTFGPAIAIYTKNRRFSDVENDLLNITNVVTTENINTNENITLTTKFDVVDPEFHWNPPENYTEDIKKHVEEEFSLKLNTTEKPHNNSLIMFLLNYVFNSSMGSFNLRDDNKNKTEILVTTELNVENTTENTNPITNSPFYEDIFNKSYNLDHITEKPYEITTEENYSIKRDFDDYYDLLKEKVTKDVNETTTVEPTTEEVFHHFLNMDKWQEELHNLNNIDYTTESSDLTKYDSFFYDDLDSTTHKDRNNLDKTTTEENLDTNLTEYMSIGDDDTTDINTDYFETFVDDIETSESVTNKTYKNNKGTEIPELFKKETRYETNITRNETTNTKDSGDIFSNAIAKLMKIFGRNTEDKLTNNHANVKQISQDVNTTEDNLLLSEELKRLENVLDAPDSTDFEPKIDTEMTHTTEQVDL